MNQGKCKKQSTCKYVHDKNHVTVCSYYLLGKCSKSDAECVFSHLPNVFNTPSCIRSLNKGTCTKPGCKYIHDAVTDNAPAKKNVCLVFLKYGYCESGSQCSGVHLFTCPEFFEKGYCENPKCRYNHDLDPSNSAVANDLVDDDIKLFEEDQDLSDESESDESELDDDDDDDNEEIVLKIFIDDNEVASHFSDDDDAQVFSE